MTHKNPLKPCDTDKNKNRNVNKLCGGTMLVALIFLSQDMYICALRVFASVCVCTRGEHFTAQLCVWVSMRANRYQAHGFCVFIYIHSSDVLTMTFYV